jgi:hypothetical protein
MDDYHLNCIELKLVMPHSAFSKGEGSDCEISIIFVTFSSLSLLERGWGEAICAKVKFIGTYLNPI